ncbi:MAG: DUF4331 family protein [Acidobacteria bacterium]|nr:DUF4331 family protein [Acidobacteriota bacterium]MCA1651669.1 DUF4331 family protein [Acidobacteriota bacterium]
MYKVGKGTLTAVILAAAGLVSQASSHREAPGITKTPKLDGTDFYMFRSYENRRADYVTLLANYYPLQDPAGGPNFFMLDEDAVYEIHVDNTADGREDLTFQFQFQNTRKDLALTVGDRLVPVPLINVGPVGPGRDETANLNVEETYTLSIVRGPRRTGQREIITNAATGSATFKKPVDRIGDKSVPAYDAYANSHIYNVNIPGCSAGGRVFVGQRREGFVINIGEVFDLINTNPLGPEDGETNDLAGKNITTLALEVPIECLATADPVIGAWTTASAGKGKPAADGTNAAACPAGQPSARQPAANFVPTQDCQGWVPPNHPQARGTSSANPGANASASTGGGACPAGQPSSPRPAASFVPTDDCLGWVPPSHPRARSAAAGTPPGQFTQVSRLANPLVNEVVIGLKDKDKFNASEPSGDAQFLEYVTHPTLPVIIQLLFGVPPLPVPRNDLVQVFLTGIPGLNQPVGVAPSEVMRLNTTTAAVAPADQNRLGVIGGDPAGFPNGRRPGDDVVDIALRVVEGILLSPDPAAFPKLTDGAITNATISYDPLGNANAGFPLFRNTFPYLNTPLSPSPKPVHQE